MVVNSLKALGCSDVTGIMPRSVKVPRGAAGDEEAISLPPVKSGVICGDPVEAAQQEPK